MPATADQIQEMAARLKAFGVIMRLGHDLFNAADFQTAAVMAVNNARPVVGFASSTLLWVQDKKVDIISQYAQAVTNVNSRQAVLQRDLLEHIGKLDDVLEISAANAALRLKKIMLQKKFTNKLVAYVYSAVFLCAKGTVLSV